MFYDWIALCRAVFNSNMDPQTKQNTIPIPRADLGFVVRGAWVGEGSGDHVPSGSKAELWEGAQGAKPSPEALGVWGITDIYLNDNFQPTTPFLSDQKNLTLSLNFVW